MLNHLTELSSENNEANEKIGDINEVILDRSGKVANVILGVGGVLGLGEHYVAVAFDKLKWVDQPVMSTTASTTSAPANAPAKLAKPCSLKRKRSMPKFAIGDVVDKDKTHSGTVIAVFKTVEGEQRYAVDMEGHGALQSIMECNLVPHETPQ